MPCTGVVLRGMHSPRVELCITHALAQLGSVEVFVPGDSRARFAPCSHSRYAAEAMPPIPRQQPHRPPRRRPSARLMRLDSSNRRPSESRPAMSLTCRASASTHTSMNNWRMPRLSTPDTAIRRIPRRWAAWVTDRIRPMDPACARVPSLEILKYARRIGLPIRSNPPR